MSGSEEEAAGRRHGFDGWELYFLGRHGVLGSDPAAAAAAAYFFPVAHVRSNYERALAVLTPEQAVAEYLMVCHEWGRTHLADFVDVAALADLLEPVVDAAATAGCPLFAAWRTLDRPAEPPARCVHLTHLLREHRGGLYGLAVVASGLDPLTAILTAPGTRETSEAHALEYGWAGPYPVVTDNDRERARRAEALSDDLASHAYAVLNDRERDDLVRLLNSAESHRLRMT
jgi:hypothetical protein